MSAEQKEDCHLLLSSCVRVAIPMAAHSQDDRFSREDVSLRPPDPHVHPHHQHHYHHYHAVTRVQRHKTLVDN